MATLVLSTAGSLIGSALGGPVGGAIGRVIGSAAGSYATHALFGPGRKTRFVEGPRLTDVAGMASTEGDPIPRARAPSSGESGRTAARLTRPASPYACIPAARTKRPIR